MTTNVGELSASVRAHLQWAVNAGLLDASVVEEVTESITAIVLLNERGLITQRLADHLIDKLGIVTAAQVVAERQAEAVRIA